MEVQLTGEKKLIAIIAMPNSMLLDVAGPCDVFHRTNMILEEKYGDGAPGYELAVVSPDSSKMMKSASGVNVIYSHTFESLTYEKIDTLLVAGFSFSLDWKTLWPFIQWLKKSAKNIRRIGSVCLGAFVLAEAGILNGKKATTHWLHVDKLQSLYPDLEVDPDPIFIRDGNVYTSAGVSSGLDLALSLVEEDLGKDIALEVARQLVLYLRRPGNQSQFSTALTYQTAEKEPLRELQSWLIDHVDQQHTVETLAEKCAMSPRNFARVFVKETGLTPGKYLEKLRIETARRMLETTHLPLDHIAADCGLGSADTMRRIFLRNLKVTPSEYRRTFQTIG